MRSERQLTRSSFRKLSRVARSATSIGERQLQLGLAVRGLRPRRPRGPSRPVVRDKASGRSTARHRAAAPADPDPSSPGRARCRATTSVTVPCVCSWPLCPSRRCRSNVQRRRAGARVVLAPSARSRPRRRLEGRADAAILDLDVGVLQLEPIERDVPGGRCAAGAAAARSRWPAARWPWPLQSPAPAAMSCCRFRLPSALRHTFSAARCSVIAPMAIRRSLSTTVVSAISSSGSEIQGAAASVARRPAVVCRIGRRHTQVVHLDARQPSATTP